MGGDGAARTCGAGLLAALGSGAAACGVAATGGVAAGAAFPAGTCWTELHCGHLACLPAAAAPTFSMRPHCWQANSIDPVATDGF